MKLEDQVVSLSLAKRLNELGVKQESLYWWVLDIFTKRDAVNSDIKWTLSNSSLSSLQAGGAKMENYEPLPAYTVAELGEMLPKEVRSPALTEDLTLTSIYQSDLGQWQISYTFWECNEAWDRYAEFDENEADARANMLIYLIENELMEVEYPKEIK